MPAGVMIRKSVPSGLRKMFRAVTSTSCASRPNRIGRAVVSSSMWLAEGSSALTIAALGMPLSADESSAAKSLPFASRYASNVSWKSRWSPVMLVKAATSYSTVVEAIEREAMARGFDDGEATSGVGHLAQRTLDGCGFRRRHPGGHVAGVAVGDVEVDRAEPPDAGTRCLQHAGEQVTRGGLAIGPRDANHREFAPGVTEEPGSRSGQRGARLLDRDDCSRVIQPTPRILPVALDDAGRRPLADGAREVLVAIDAEAGNGDEKAALSNRSGIRFDLPDQRVRITRLQTSAGQLDQERCDGSGVVTHAGDGTPRSGNRPEATARSAGRRRGSWKQRGRSRPR